MRRRTGTGFGLPRFVLFLLPLLFAAAGFVPWVLTQTVLVDTPARALDWPLLLWAAGLLLLGGLLVTALLWAFLLGPVVRTADAAARAAEGDESAWPELEVATGAARDLGAILKGTVLDLLHDGVRTRDLGGDLGTIQFSERVGNELGTRVKAASSGST